MTMARWRPKFISAVSCITLTGCPIIPVMDYWLTDRKENFEAWANGIVNSQFGSKYKNAVTGGFDAGYGVPIETRNFDEEHTEHVYRQMNECRIGVVVNKNTGSIDAWRYVSEPSFCWAWRGSGA
jgi:hypothetical protein